MRLPALLLAAAALGAAPAAAQRPRITKVEPPTWWAGHSINPVRVLVRGTALGDAAFDCGPLTCGNVRVNDRGTYAFVDVTIADGTAPGTYPIRLRTPRGRAAFDFTVQEALPSEGRFQGFGANDVLYLIMPDRFANGDPSNDDPAKSRGLLNRAEARAYHGGDLEGIRRKLPYLKDLGVTAIWMTPVFDNTDTRDRSGEHGPDAFTTAYHGYHAIDFYGVEERFGDLASLRRLVDDAHAQGMKIIMDQVENHTGPEHPWLADSPTPTWFNGTKERHIPNNWQVWALTDPAAPPAVRDSVLNGWFANILPDLNQDDPEVARYLIQNTLWWIGTTGVDGIRQDTWPYAPRTFWAQWMAAIKAQHPTLRVVGEMWDGDPVYLSFFEGGRVGWDGVDDAVDHLFDFPLAFVANGAFAGGGNVRDVAMLLAKDRLYQRPQDLVTFLDNHDIARFMHHPKATVDGLLLAFTFQLTARGIPMLYYGTEIGLRGGGDPDNRRDFPGGFPGDARDAFTEGGRTPDEQRIFAHVRALLRLRAERPELRAARTENLLVDPQVYAYRRGETVVVLNNGTTPATLRLPLPAGRAAVVGGCAAPSRDGDATTLTVPARTGCMF
jgi:glycosidase